ncbi:hypothetical protein AOC36_08045 [Erysipelothrix larvae]|uniref:DUF1307 domain-containing protein n=1 Tax=Erysipelothrix larvae TaxID=1514105 RepID=A0A0X8H0R0_9FIRM|nr:DUF1307 domain-containing protein [Erysipelothrix larvae]AMC93938.1 hypothetical protein AOC36_08045 [Erysipelothrix larvae]
MRKHVIIGGILFGLLSGCSATSNLDTTVNCSYTDEIGDTYQETFVSVDNKVQTNDIVILRDYAPDVASGQLTKEEIQEEYNYRDAVVYDGIDGLDYSYTMDDAFVVETIHFDYNTVSFTYLADIGYLDSEDYEYIALDLTLKNLKESGYTCDD